MRKQASLAVLVVLAAVVLGAAVGHTQSAPSGRQAWEYTMVEWREMGGPGLKRLGDEGWELVAVTVEDFGTSIRHTWYYFKRPK